MKPSYYQRTSDNRWVGSVSLGTDIYGKRKRKTIYGNTKKEVQQKMNLILYEIQTGTYSEPSRESLVCFLNEFFEINKNNWSETTTSLYKMYITTHIEPYFKDMKLKDIKPMVLDKFYNHKMSNGRNSTFKVKGKTVTQHRNPLSINSVIKLNKFLSMAFKYAVKNDLIKSNPTEDVMLNKKQKYEPVVYEESEFLSLLSKVKGTDDEIPIILGAGCGLRRGEIFGLRWENIDFLKEAISIEITAVRFDKHIEKEPKTESSKRVIKAPKYVIKVLKEYYEYKDSPLLTEKVITRWKAPSYSERFKKLLEEHGMKHTRLHDLRHYNAVIMMKKGIPDKVAAERLGHSNVTTLREVYQHVMKDMDDGAANEINSMFENKL